MPFFGFAHRLDKIQFGFHAIPNSAEDNLVDHSKFAIEHAQHIANFIVDEARLSQNQFEWTNVEQQSLLNNYDVYVINNEFGKKSKNDEVQFLVENKINESFV